MHADQLDTALPYAKLDMWAKFTDFQVRIRDMIVKRQALDRIMIGLKTASSVRKPLTEHRTLCCRT